MAERRQKAGSILLRIGSKDRKGRVLEIYSAELWPEQREADTGLYRVRIDDRWVAVGGQRYTFFTPEALGQLIAQELTAPGALAALQRPTPAMRKGDWVRWYGPKYGAHQFRLSSDPVLWLDGQWRVLINDLRLGRQLVCCDELVPLDRFGREVPNA
jgi:hypothetical protein